MEKAYDLKALGKKIIEKARQNGLHLAEDAAQAIAKASYLGIKEWAQESAAITPTPVDNVIVKFVDYADDFVLEQIEKMDLDGDGK